MGSFSGTEAQGELNLPRKDSADSRRGWVRVYVYGYSTSGASTKYRVHARVQCMCSALRLLADYDSGVTRTAVLCAIDRFPIRVIIVRVNLYA